MNKCCLLASLWLVANAAAMLTNYVSMHFRNRLLTDYLKANDRVPSSYLSNMKAIGVTGVVIAYLTPMKSSRTFEVGKNQAVKYSKLNGLARLTMALNYQLAEVKVELAGFPHSYLPVTSLIVGRYSKDNDMA